MSVPLSRLGPPPHQVWDYFRTAKDAAGKIQKYQKDESHNAMWCSFCFNAKVEEIETRERNAQLLDPSSEVRVRSAIEMTVYSIMKPIVGKVDHGLKHLLKDSCRIPVNSEVKSWARRTLAERSNRRKENLVPLSRTDLATDLGVHPFSPSGPPHDISILDRISGVPIRVADLQVADMGSDRTPKRLKTSHSLNSLDGNIATYSSQAPSALQAEFNADLCSLFVALGWAWDGADQDIMRTFIRKYTVYQAPSAYTLSGPVLDQQAKEVEQRMKSRLSGKLGTGQCDGWKNVARTSVVSSLITVDYEPYLIDTHDVSAERKTADNLLNIVIMNIMYAMMTLEVTVIAWCSDAGGDSASMRRKLVQRYPWLIVLDCWAHQIHLVVGDYFKLELPWIEYVDMATEVIKWFNNHGYANGLLRAQQQSINVKILVLILPVATRWTSHYLSIRRLRQLRRFIEACVALHYDDLVESVGKTKKAKDHAKKVLQYVQDGDFWKGLEKVERDLQPLAVAANLTQGASTRLDQVLLTLANLYRHFSDPKYESSVRIGIHASLQKRWAKNADIDVFVISVFLNPYIRNKLFRPGNPRLTPIEIYNLCTRVYKRIFPEGNCLDPGFHHAFFAYIEGVREFSADRMKLDAFKAAYDNSGTPIDIVSIWTAMDDHSDSGRNNFIKLAIRILSVVTNSASAEHVFSQMGLTHTRLRNRFKPLKVHKMVMLKMDLKRRYRDDSTKRLKRKFTELTTTVPVLPPSESSTERPVSTPSLTNDTRFTPELTTVGSTSLSDTSLDILNPVPTLTDSERFHHVTAPLIADTMADDESLYTLPELSPSPDILRTVPLPSGHAGPSSNAAPGPSRNTQPAITEANGLNLGNIFDFTKTEDFVTFSWNGGWTSLEGEMLVYEVMSVGGEVGDDE
ncbi:hypothetical protein EUX98_g9503 [Antrodiella citrinella]|uniref:HAT C-terminal dimerisation domain-containing protein n=1 Tax=Antrodiella citrinella TaxID=2447956 RepID=A0A4S4LTW7_9APHY|nr:hypothetical protein EUX98_g9503 [Antrodiella citrinella]